VLPEMDAEQSVKMAEAMRLRVAGLGIAHEKAGHADHVTVSIGLATLVAGAQSGIADLLGAADRALYASKRAGRNRVVAHTG
jgi:diguanylate cyclase (GGDEF)-like protein